MSLIAILVTLFFLHTLFSARLQRTVVTAPMLFTAAGVGVFFWCRATPSWQGDHAFFLRMAEVGLVLLLFTDASRTNLTVLRSIRNLPARLLSIGMLATLLLGALAALLVFPGLSVWEAGILAAILAPTDAGLGQIIVTSPRVPMKIRQALNVEAGLNDGLSVPFMLFFIALASAGTAAHDTQLARLILEQLVYGALVGAAIGFVGGALLGRAEHHGWIDPSFLQIGVVALPILCALASETVAASMFIAAFVAGLAVQVRFPEAGRHSVEFTEEWGQSVNLSVFFLFGLFLAPAWNSFTLSHLVYALLSLTLVRMLPVALALMGTGLSRASVLFIGWFGPRGLASIVLGLVYLEHAHHSPVVNTLRLVVTLTVFLSILAHGFTAGPGIQAYSRALRRLPAGAPELESPPTQPA